MEALLLEIAGVLRECGRVDDKMLAQIIRKHNTGLPVSQHHSKKKLLPYCQHIKKCDPGRWTSWNLDEATEKLLEQTLQVKPRRTASGVATITVITKPWKCASSCLYCPSDVRMPKSYLHDEPACQRAERNFFDPYLQVTSRLRALTHMGHKTDKIELIVLGGTWSDYPAPYQTWFASELFRALNDGAQAERNATERRKRYRACGIANQPDNLAAQVEGVQRAVGSGALAYNQAVEQLYGNPAWRSAATFQTASLEELERQQRANETAQHRVVGLVIETRPDTITAHNLRLIRQLGCTKIQMGVQSLNPRILKENRRAITIETMQRAFELARAFGFKIHAHFMVNLFGSSPAADKRDYQRFVTEAPWQPDEVKLYPCALIDGTGLCARYEEGTWQPYSEQELVDVLVADTLATPPFIRVSRMIRDFSAADIVAGNKKGNLRQLVEGEAARAGTRIEEIRYREISTSETDVGSLALSVVAYETTATHERFLQWVTPESRIAGFLRLSLPKPAYVGAHASELPIGPGEAMIREVHVYGQVAELHATSQGAQHLGLGKRLVQEACTLAAQAGFTKMNVISAVGTREYYRALGFHDNGLYQQKPLG